MFADENLDYPAIRAYRKELMEEYLAKNGIEIKRGAIELLNFLKENPAGSCNGNRHGTDRKIFKADRTIFVL